VVRLTFNSGKGWFQVQKGLEADVDCITTDLTASCANNGDDAGRVSAVNSFFVRFSALTLAAVIA
jgi:hypothetical protein